MIGSQIESEGGRIRCGASNPPHRQRYNSGSTPHPRSGGWGGGARHRARGCAGRVGTQWRWIAGEDPGTPCVRPRHASDSSRPPREPRGSRAGAPDQDTKIGWASNGRGGEERNGRAGCRNKRKTGGESGGKERTEERNGKEGDERSGEVVGEESGLEGREGQKEREIEPIGKDKQTTMTQKEEGEKKRKRARGLEELSIERIDGRGVTVERINKDRGAIPGQRGKRNVEKYGGTRRKGQYRARWRVRQKRGGVGNGGRHREKEEYGAVDGEIKRQREEVGSGEVRRKRVKGGRERREQSDSKEVPLDRGKVVGREHGRVRGERAEELERLAGGDRSSRRSKEKEKVEREASVREKAKEAGAHDRVRGDEVGREEGRAGSGEEEEEGRGPVTRGVEEKSERRQRQEVGWGEGTRAINRTAWEAGENRAARASVRSTPKEDVRGVRRSEKRETHYLTFITEAEDQMRNRARRVRRCQGRKKEDGCERAEQRPQVEDKRVQYESKVRGRRSSRRKGLVDVEKKGKEERGRAVSHHKYQRTRQITGYEEENQKVEEGEEEGREEGEEGEVGRSAHLNTAPRLNLKDDSSGYMIDGELYAVEGERASAGSGREGSKKGRKAMAGRHNGYKGEDHEVRRRGLRRLKERGVRGKGQIGREDSGGCTAGRVELRSDGWNNRGRGVERRGRNREGGLGLRTEVKAELEGGGSGSKVAGGAARSG
ncbi:hypothetical protein Tco_1032155 [Tanacetum coccineum]|uniref:Uncharacterized protein n=1 Tax=Tanacetum coccineum TaxID=301880 RepID=A0ABQ5GBV4_9ASTR